MWNRISRTCSAGSANCSIKQAESLTKVHFFCQDITYVSLPERFTYPFSYTPHPLVRQAAAEVEAYLHKRPEWDAEIARGKMFGVLLVRLPDGRIGYLAAFSGHLAGKGQHAYFVPPVYDLSLSGGFFRKGEEAIGAMAPLIGVMASRAACWRQRMEMLGQKARQEEQAWKEFCHRAKQARDERRGKGVNDEAEAERMRDESRFQKAELVRIKRRWKQRMQRVQRHGEAYAALQALFRNRRKQASARLQQEVFRHFRILNVRGEVRDLCELFKETPAGVPPAGTGECALPKLLQYAYLHHLTPLAMGEFWQGESPQGEIREAGHFYPSCTAKCKPLLAFALQGLEVDPDPLEARQRRRIEPEVVYEDSWMVVVDKPAGMLSVPGRVAGGCSVQQFLAERAGNGMPPLPVHRLDMDTSGLLVVAKDMDTYRLLRQQFERREVRKQYTALLEGRVDMPDDGWIELPLGRMPDEPFRRRVDKEGGKYALTRYHIVERKADMTRVEFFPVTGRTHQLRVHAAHSEGLGHPIAGDPVYGHAGSRMYLHAVRIEFTHPRTGRRIGFCREADF